MYNILFYLPVLVPFNMNVCVCVCVCVHALACADDDNPTSMQIGDLKRGGGGGMGGDAGASQLAHAVIG